MFRKSYLTPKNYGRANTVAPVQQEVDFTVSRANSQLMEAIAVDGPEVLFWKKTDEGNYCTCRYGKNLQYKKIGSDNQDVASNAETIDLDNGNGGGENDIDKGNAATYLVRNQWTERDDKENSARNNAERIQEIDRYNPDTGEQTKDTKPDYPSNQLIEQDEEDEDAFLSAPVDSDSMSGMEKSQCGICLGTGKTQAWNMFGGKREIFDSFNVRKLSGFTIQDDARPIAFTTPFSKDNYVEWHYTMPTYFNSILNFAVRNNTKSIRYLKIFYKVDGTNGDFQRLTEDFLNSRKGVPTKLILRVQPIREGIDGSLQFTHIEMSWELSKPQKIQMAPISVATNSQISASLTSSSFTFPPTFNNIDKDDIFLDKKYGYMWKVTDYTDFETRSRQVLGWTVSARNLQAFEQQALLKVAYDKYYETSFAGLETFQGSLLSGSDLL